MSKDLSAYIVYGAREGEVIFKGNDIDNIAAYIDSDLHIKGIQRIRSFDSEDSSFLGVVLESAEDWESASLNLLDLVVKQEEAKLVWAGILDNPEVLCLELIPSYL